MKPGTKLVCHVSAYGIFTKGKSYFIAKQCEDSKITYMIKADDRERRCAFPLCNQWLKEVKITRNLPEWW